ncbi:MAG TPA: T9SS type A sorting domain-containing protein, partial [Bacteroidetes bacterium]|nr:T9SS type A sorting domain-containing protein [Bacteroidota bacterium]
YSDEGDIKCKQLRAQEVLPTGEFVLTRAKTIQYVTLPSGACAEFVTETTYSDYNFDDRRVENRSKTIQPKGLAKKVIISPNPIDDMVHIEYSQIFEGSERLDLAIYHVDGELKKQIQVLNIGTVEIPVSDLEAGVYLIKIKNDTGKVITKKFVKL